MESIKRSRTKRLPTDTLSFILNITLFLFIILVTSGSQLAIAYDPLDKYLNTESPKTISMDFRDAELNNVLKVFSQQSGLNFIAASTIQSLNVNLYLENVPVEEALERILTANNLTYELKPGSNIFVVKTVVTPERTLTTRVYKLKYATLPSSKLNSTFTISSGDDEDSGADEGDSAEGIISAIESILTEDGSIVEDTRTNSLVITDLPSQFDMIERTIQRLDVRIPQILIEVEMLDVSNETAAQLGAKFSNTPVTFQGGEKDSLLPFDTDNILDKGKFIFDPTDAPQYRVSTLSFAGLSFALQFLRTQSDTRNLARPRILTLNNETAQIQISTDEAIGLQSTTTSTDGASESVAEAERVETGVFLTVTPQANVDTGEIVMAIEPRVVQARTGSTFDGQTFKDPEERGAKSILRIQNGDTIIVGGLLRSTSADTRTKVPVLSKIPLMGAAFRHKDKASVERELIIFITPHILNERFANTRVAETDDLEREQNIPQKRLKKINRELTFHEEHPQK